MTEPPPGGRRSPEPTRPKLASLTPAYFQHVYEQNADPWNFETSPYEAAKYAETIRSLPRPLYERGLEVGCSIGVLTSKLAAHCTSLLSVDVSEPALRRAAELCAALPNVRLQRLQIPEEQPEGVFDLILVSEVAYYWDLADLSRAINLLASHHAPGGHLVLVHWTPEVPDYPLTGDAVHDLWCARPEYRHLKHHRAEQFRLDVLERNG